MFSINKNIFQFEIATCMYFFIECYNLIPPPNLALAPELVYMSLDLHFDGRFLLYCKCFPFLFPIDSFLQVVQWSNCFPKNNRTFSVFGDLQAGLTNHKLSSFG